MYKINTYILIESEDEQTYETIEEAQDDINHYSCMQPENIYDIEKIEV